MRNQRSLMIGTGVIGTLALATGIGLHLKAKYEERQVKRMLQSPDFREFYINKLDREYAWE